MLNGVSVPKLPDTMLLQKTFHVHQPLEETKARLANLASYRRHLDGLRKAVITADGVAQFDCETPRGFHAHFVLIELPTDDSNQLLFQSTTGNVKVAGLIEYLPVRENLTEVQLTVQYTLKSPVQWIINALTSSIDRFVNAQLRRLQAALDGNPLPVSHAPSHARTFTAHIPQLAH